MAATLAMTAPAAVAQSTAAGVTPEMRQRATARATSLVKETALAEALRPALIAAVARDLAWLNIARPNCSPEPVAIRLVRLNDDALPDVHVTTRGDCVAGDTAPYNWLYISAPNRQGWRGGYMKPGDLQPLGTAVDGVRLLALAPPTLPGEVFVYAWAGNEYVYRCMLATATDLESSRCPPDVGPIVGPEIPGFTDAVPTVALRAVTLPADQSVATRPRSNTTLPPSAATAGLLAEAAVSRVLTPLALPAAAALSLRETLVRDFTRERVRPSIGSNAYVFGSCKGVTITARLVHLNRDGHPEVEVDVAGPCFGASRDRVTWLYVQDLRTLGWHNSIPTSVIGDFRPLRSRHLGYVDVEGSGAGMRNGVWQFDGRVYRLFCTRPADGSNAPVHSVEDCPFTIPQWQPGDDFVTVGSTVAQGQPCDDPNIVTEYDRAAEAYHVYGASGDLNTPVCNVASAGCTPENIFRLMLSRAQYIVPTSDHAPVTQCRRTLVRIFAEQNPIRSVIDPVLRTVTNYTLPGHRLHPGWVRRQVVLWDSRVHVVTEGGGTGALGWANEAFSPLVWGAVDASLCQGVRQAGIRLIDNSTPRCTSRHAGPRSRRAVPY